MSITQQIKSIDIQGRRWFQRSYGNTYHRVYISINKEDCFESEITYGYGNDYLRTAREWMERNGFIKFDCKKQSLHRFCKDNAIEFNDTVIDVKRKKDL